VDVPHFAAARLPAPDPNDQEHIVRPRLGFFGVIDERMDLEIIHGVAAARPEWQLVIIGPVVKINPEVLPRRSNIHYLGSKTYDVLPRYIRGWDVALLPFARNDATRFISPTKTPEYLAAGKPVVSTSIADVVKPYGEAGLVRIADTVDGFIQAVDQALIEDHAEHIRRSDSFLAAMSWDATWRRMEQLLNAAIVNRASKKPAVNLSLVDNPASTDNLNMGLWACGVAQGPERPERNSDV
jgi:UDP-galactopyranose mutase